jgi:hypothetical protein
MKVRNSVILMLVLLLITSFSFGCKKKGGSEGDIQTTAVQRGNISLEVSASGNLALSKSEDLAFEVEGYVYRVLVEEGDQYRRQNLLAKPPLLIGKKRRALWNVHFYRQSQCYSAQISLEDTLSCFTGTSVTSGTSPAPDRWK